MREEDKPWWRAAIGGNADHYLQHFKRMSSGNRRWLPSWNWAAFLHSTAWFCYRRMYGLALLNLLVSLIGVGFYIEWIASGANLRLPLQIFWITYLLAVFVAVPMFADSIYHRHLESRRARGAKPPSAWTALAAVVLVPAWFVPYIAPPAYQDYSMRADISEALVAAHRLRTEVTEFHSRQGRLPGPAEAARFSDQAASVRAHSIAYDAELRALVMTMSQPTRGNRFGLFAAEQGGQLVWTCRSIDHTIKFLPKSCRG